MTDQNQPTEPDVPPTGGSIFDDPEDSVELPPVPSEPVVDPVTESPSPQAPDTSPAPEPVVEETKGFWRRLFGG